MLNLSLFAYPAADFCALLATLARDMVLLDIFNAMLWLVVPGRF